MQLLSYILSVGGLASIVASLLIDGKSMKKNLAFLALGNLLVALSYVCTWNLSGFITSVVATVQTVINYFFDVKGKKVPVLLLGIYALSFVVVNLWVYTSVIDLLAIAASLTAVIVASRKAGKEYRVWASANNFIWCVFDILKRSYGPLITHGIILGFTLIGMLMHDIGKKQKEE